MAVSVLCLLTDKWTLRILIQQAERDIAAVEAEGAISLFTRHPKQMQMTFRNSTRTTHIDIALRQLRLEAKKKRLRAAISIFLCGTARRETRWDRICLRFYQTSSADSKLEFYQMLPPSAVGPVFLHQPEERRICPRREDFLLYMGCQHRMMQSAASSGRVGAEGFV